MKWIKKGKIFDPTEYLTNDGYTEFAQSPQTLVFDNFVRIYFSTRTRDQKGEYISHISFIDMDINLTSIINVSKKTVIEAGARGTFDEHGIFPINPFKDGDRILAYTCGWSRRVSVPVETSIGIVESFNQGETFHRIGAGPILTATVNEPMLVGDGFVKQYNGTYYMWYIFGTQWMPASTSEPPARIYKIAYATSADGLNWQKNDGQQIISNVLNEIECQALPSVVKINDRFHMYFCFREATDFRKNPGRSYKIGYAYSDNLTSWTRSDKNSGISCGVAGWDCDMMCYPHIFKIKDKVFLLYNGNEFGKYGFGLAELLSLS